MLFLLQLITKFIPVANLNEKYFEAKQTTTKKDVFMRMHDEEFI